MADEIVFEQGIDHHPYVMLGFGIVFSLIVGSIAGLEPLLIFGVIGGAVVVACAAFTIQMRRASKQRALDMGATALRLGMEYSASGGDEWRQWLLGTHTMHGCRRVEVRNLLHGTFRGVPIALADVRGISNSDSDDGFAGTVVMLPKESAGADFVIRRANWTTGLKRFLSKRQVVLDQTSHGQEFSRRYELYADDAESVQTAFPVAAAAFLASRPDWLIERRDDRFLIAKVSPPRPLAPPNAKSFRLSRGAEVPPASACVAIESLPTLIKHAVVIGALLTPQDNLDRQSAAE